MVEHYRPRGTGELLDQFDGLGVVFLLDHLVVLEGRVGHGTFEELEAGGIEGDGMFLPADVLNVGIVRNHDPVPQTLAGGGISIDVDIWLRAIWRRREVVEGGGHGICCRHGHLDRQNKWVGIV